ncbi:ABC transporter permease [Blautia schinkii]|nr:ABC transporter permease [Blautia schinkii]
MRVFSACMKMMKHHKFTFIIYFSVFAALLLSMTLLGDSNTLESFTEEKPKYALMNRDEGGVLEEGLAAVLQAHGTLYELEDSKEAMMDAGFFGAVDGIFIIPEGFEESFWNGEEMKLQMWQRPSTAVGYYLQSITEQYLSMVRMKRDINTNLSREEISKGAVSAMEKETKITLRKYMSGTMVSEKIQLCQRFMPYVLLLLCISCINIVFINFKKPEIRMRNRCSPLRPSSMALQKLLYAGGIGLAAWILLNCLGAAVCFKEWQGMDLRFPALLVANNFAMLLLAVSIALLTSSFVEGENTQNFVANLLSLALCFLSGVFVPLEQLSSSMLHVAKFIPVYWYVDNLEKITGLTGFTVENLTPIWQGIGIQAAFAAALFCIYLVVNKYKEQSAESYGAVRTEVEA